MKRLRGQRACRQQLELRQAYRRRGQQSPNLKGEPRKHARGASTNITSRLQKLREAARSELPPVPPPGELRKGGRPLGLFAHALSKVTQQ
jgi:hypothetical protein